jgi:hypothetical protein
VERKSETSETQTQTQSEDDISAEKIQEQQPSLKENICAACAQQKFFLHEQPQCIVPQPKQKLMS